MLFRVDIPFIGYIYSGTNVYLINGFLLYVVRLGFLMCVLDCLRFFEYLRLHRISIIKSLSFTVTPLGICKSVPESNRMLIVTLYPISFTLRKSNWELGKGLQ